MWIKLLVLSPFRSSWLALRGVLLLSILILPTACVSPQSGAQSNSSGQSSGEESVAVEAAIARPGSTDADLEYTGTTQPLREVSLRSQVEGQLLDLSVDVGDLVSQGQTVGQIDDQILQTAVGEAAAELEARQSEVEQARSQVVDAETKVSQAQVELQQAEADAKRLETLALQGAISVQEAELAQTALKTAEQVLRSAEEQVRTREGAVEAAEGRVRSQEAAVEQARERLSYTGLSSPISGVVLERLAEPGNFMQAGNEVLKLGDFSSVKVMVQVSELDRATIRQGQPVQVSLDAFPNQTFSGRISRISPVADSTARLIPVEVTIPNRASDIGSGLLARVNFSAASPQAITVPESALQVGEAASGDVVFVVMGEGENATVQPRSVQVGDRADGQVEIRSGLEAGESYIIRSNQPLQAGQPVRLSILSEGA